MHELLHKLVHLRLRYPWLPQTEIQGVFQELLVVRADVDADWYSRRRTNSRASHVKRELANRYWHTVDAEVAEAKNS